MVTVGHKTTVRRPTVQRWLVLIDGASLAHHAYPLQCPGWPPGCPNPPWRDLRSGRRVCTRQLVIPS